MTYDEALAAVDDDPENGHAWFILGAFTEAEGDLSQARDYYRHALDLNPDLYEARLALNKGEARVLAVARQGIEQQQRQEAAKAPQLDPEGIAEPNKSLPKTSKRLLLALVALIALCTMSTVFSRIVAQPEKEPTEAFTAQAGDTMKSNSSGAAIARQPTGIPTPTRAPSSTTTAREVELVLDVIPATPSPSATSEPATATSTRTGLEACKIMPLGDSITEGLYGGIEPSGDLRVGYRQPLYLALTTAGYNVDFVGGLQHGSNATPPFDIDHEGHSGETDDYIADHVYERLVANPADIVLLHIGTNHLDLDPSDVERILDEIDRYSTDTIVVLARIVNRQEYHPEVAVFNDNVQAMAETRIANGDKIIIVDQESALDYPGDMYDDFHPNQAGYDKMAAVWQEGLEGLLPACDWPTPLAAIATRIPTATQTPASTVESAPIDSPAPSPTITAIEAPSDDSMPTATVMSYALNVRGGPDRSSSIVGELRRGQEVGLAGFRNENGDATWVQVVLPDGTTGWVNARYLQSDFPFADLAVSGQ
ncbi:MAG: SH3 domain-containing protein [Chloroflexota bacterium]|nr:SH3 domain-containing protein [Chloroflexota bacterium]